jgi:1-deoxy-D-xylulose-5-phosphate synthase
MSINEIIEVNSPQELKKIPIADLTHVANDIRNLILNVTSKQMGHVGPNLGIVEATIALHYVFDSPKDKIVFDVSHQSYPHKILTGKRESFKKLHLKGGDNGYTNRFESKHDFFNVGHTSTSISLASGLQKARDLTGGKENIIAVIGDGSLSGGESFEGFDSVGATNTNFIAVVNDNQISIDNNHGGLYKNLADLRNGTAKTNYFTAMGFNYTYVPNGNSIPDLITAFEKVKNSNKPVLVHISTQKGKGFKPAEIDKEKWHYSPGAFDIKTGKVEKHIQSEKNYVKLFEEFLTNEIDNNPKGIVAMYPATPVFSPNFKDKYSNNFVDNAIAEVQQSAFASGISTYPDAKVKAYGVYFSSFVQRAYDQMIQDVALNNSPATFLIIAAGISNSDWSHLGIFDIPMLSNIPNFVYLEPANKNDFEKMLKFCKNYTDGPTAIRVNQTVSNSNALNNAGIKNIELNKSEVVTGSIKEAEILLIGLGQYLQKAIDVSEILNKKVAIINPRFITGLDVELLSQFNGKLVATFESGQIEGGFGPKVSSFFAQKGIKVLNFGANKEFTNATPLDELEQKFELTPELSVAKILQNL